MGICFVLPLIDSWGRRPLLFVGFSGICATLLVGGVAAAVLGREGLRQWWPLEVVLLSAYIVSYQFGPSSTFYAIASEIFPLKHRSMGNSVAAFMVFAGVWLNTFVYPRISGSVELWVLMVGAAVVAAITGVAIYFVLPETKGVQLEDVTEMWRAHINRGKYGQKGDKGP